MVRDQNKPIIRKQTDELSDIPSDLDLEGIDLSDLDEPKSTKPNSD
jgi:hypothetical protein